MLYHGPEKRLVYDDSNRYVLLVRLQLLLLLDHYHYFLLVVVVMVMVTLEHIVPSPAPRIPRNTGRVQL
jgi:hypothetical protein